MSNFDFTKAEWPTIHTDCVRAESYLSSDPVAACFYAPRCSAGPEESAIGIGLRGMGSLVGLARPPQQGGDRPDEVRVRFLTHERGASQSV